MSSIFGKKHKSHKVAQPQITEAPPQKCPEVPKSAEVHYEIQQQNGTYKNDLDGINDNKTVSPESPVNDESSNEKPKSSPAPQMHKIKLTFHCQQAQGSPTGIISGFTNVKELYKKISECYDFPPTEILFCTLNTHKIDMNRLLGGQIGLDDFIFAHRKGRPKEVEVYKDADALGLTITDNGAGYAFIKRIKENSIISKLGCIQVGDHLEKIDSKSLVGSRHFEVAKLLKEIPKGTTFILRLVEPLKAGFANIGPRSGPAGKKSGNYGSGTQTLRFKSNGGVNVEEVDDVRTMAEEKINELLESFLGINDAELASQIWELSKNSANTMEFAEAIDQSDLEAFGFTDEFIFELWGAITDAKSGRLAAKLASTMVF